MDYGAYWGPRTKLSFLIHETYRVLFYISILLMFLYDEDYFARNKLKKRIIWFFKKNPFKDGVCVLIS